MLQVPAEPAAPPTEPAAVEKEAVELPNQAQSTQAPPVQEDVGTYMEEEDQAPAAVTPPQEAVTPAVEVPSPPNQMEVVSQETSVDALQQEAEPPVQPSATEAEPMQAVASSEEPMPVSFTPQIIVMLPFPLCLQNPGAEQLKA